MWKKIVLFAAGATILSGVVSFLGFSLLARPSATAQTLNQAVEPRVRNVSSAAEARQLVGYDVAVPGFLPEGYQLVRTTVTRMPGQARLPYQVEQFWTRKDEPGFFISLTQDPTLKGLGGGEPTDIAGVQGQRLVDVGNTPERPLTYESLFWRQGTAGFWLIGTLDATTTEETLKQIAASVR